MDIAHVGTSPAQVGLLVVLPLFFTPFFTSFLLLC